MKIFFVLLSLILTFTPPTDCDNVPSLNKEIVSFVKEKISKKVGRGECWDLASEALNYVEADWDKAYGFGKEVDPKKDCIYPGDIIQFKNVEIKYTRGNAHYVENMGKHTAIIMEVKEKGSYVIADQNNGHSGRKVGLSDLKLENMTKGKIKMYRPVKE